ncbi:MAG: translation initiation factor IF-2 [Candidatus Aquicultor primus]|uniref:Translation initiation factor IF-2 n=1 Tax=Candidatus Aquicultor primus TaxID=1797195 RepID=A0A1F2UR33_9ACTN|nr:MAG: translation initiation factor IF-2 [Candidatus Aquicultor primus]
MRVYELAKQMGVSSTELMNRLQKLGVEVKNHFAAIEPSVVKELQAAQTAGSSPQTEVKKKKPAGDKKPTVTKQATAAKPAKAQPVSKPAATSDKVVKPAGSAAKAPAKPAPKPAQKTPAKPAPKAAPTKSAEPVQRPQAQRPEAKPAPEAAKRAPAPEQKPQLQPQPKPEVKVEAPVKEEPVAAAAPAEKAKILEIPQAATVKEFAELVGKEPTAIIKTLLKLGELVTINQSLSSDIIEILADDLGYEPKIISPEELEEEEAFEEDLTNLVPRPPVVTVMGHVDHGKTSLLDAIRKTDVMSGEAGGITQHIGAYQVVLDGRKITFIDTPGHEAFTAMRARGAQVTDIAVLVVAADDGVMPQTVEAINHAKAANVPIVVAVNKIDKENADPTRVRQELTEYALIPEEWGGDTIFVDVSAKQKLHIQDLLEMVLLVADIKELKANPNTRARGTCIEAKLERGRGPVATVLIYRGTLRVGDAVVAGATYGKVRAMSDDKGKTVLEATPAQPVEVVGLSSLPQAGEELKVVGDEKEARHIAEERALKRRLIAQEERSRVTLEDLFARIQEGEIKDLNLVIKADTQGSVEAIKDALYKLNTEEVQIRIIHTGVGGISETDIMLAAASNAIVIGFNVRPDVNAQAMAAKETVDIRVYRIIYKVVEDITQALSGLLAPEIKEVDTGRVEVRATFKVPKLGVIAGCYVQQGEVDRNQRIRLVREGQIIYDGSIVSLRRFKDDVKVVKEGFECGIGLANFQDIKEGDILESYKLVERQRQLGE